MQLRIVLLCATCCLLLAVVRVAAQEPEPTATPSVPTAVAATPTIAVTATAVLTSTATLTDTVLIGGYADGAQGVAKLNTLILLFGFSALVILQLVDMFVLRGRS